MSYSAKVFNVMIASPGDVPFAKNLAREVVYEWNAVHSRVRKIILQPTGWETHSHPSMDNKAQKVINEQIVKDSDMLVAIFWTRLGTPTDTAASGTVEEIEEHLKAGKPVMIYFSTEPVILDSVDSTQYQKLKEFKDECIRKGLVETFDSPTGFRQKFVRQLAAKVNEHKIFKSQKKNEQENYEVKVTTPAEKTIPQLSTEAKTLLIEAAQDSSGHILHAITFGGVFIQTNHKQFVEQGDKRSRAVWQGALDELSNLRLIKDRGYKGEVYQVTREGYELAEILKE